MEITVKSRYLKTDFSVMAHDAQEGNAMIIAHESLVDIIDNLIPAELEIHYDFELVKSDKGHVVVTCTICDAKGRRIKDLGEATYDSLDTKIAKSYPCLMAYYRAFDRAVIRYLAFPGKVFSSSEGVPASEEQKEMPTTPSNASEKAQSAHRAEESVNATTAPKNESERQETKQSPRSNEKTAQTGENQEKPITVEEIGALRMVFGKYKGSTIAEVTNTNPGYFAYMSAKDLTPTQRAQITAGLDYVRMLEAKRRGS